MFAEERIKRIKQLLLEVRQIDIKKLCEILSASKSTVRRDLERLVDEGFIIKHHGGVVLNSEFIQGDDLLKNAPDDYILEKAAVGQLAASLIENNDTIFLGAGNTCWQIAKNLDKSRNLQILTVCFNIVQELNDRSNIKLVFCGGDVEVENYKSFTLGKLVVNCLKEFYINKSFFTVNGISIEHGYSCNNHLLIDMYLYLLKKSDQTIVVADDSKFDKRAFKQICKFEDIKQVVTNKPVQPEYKKMVEKHKIKLYSSFDDILNRMSSEFTK